MRDEERGGRGQEGRKDGNGVKGRERIGDGSSI